MARRDEVYDTTGMSQGAGAHSGWPFGSRLLLGMGMPEGLAYKIAVFEAIDRERRFDVRAPRIPGLDYSVGVDS